MSYHTSNDLNNILRTLDSIHNTSIPSVVDSLLESHPSHPEAEKLVERGPKLVGLIGADTKSKKAALHAQASEESMRSDAEEMRELLSEATANKIRTNAATANLQFAQIHFQRHNLVSISDVPLCCGPSLQSAFLH
jgi:hypothetical protein